MTWSRESDVLERVDSSSVTDNAFCSIRRQNKFVLSGKNNAAVSFLHDLEELIDHYLISGDLTLTREHRGEEHHVALLGERLAVGISDFGNEDARIDLDITPLLRIKGAQAHEIATLMASLGSSENGPEKRIRHLE